MGIKYSGGRMKKIKIEEYSPSMGTLIDLEDEYSFLVNHQNGAINIPYNKLIYNYEKLLDKNKSYYFYCNGGSKSRKIVSILELYGYNVTQVVL